MMQRFSLIGVSLLLVTLSGCAENIYKVKEPAASQADQYVETDDLGKLPNKKIAIVSFGIEFDTHVFSVTKTSRGIADVDLSKESMQSIADDAYGKLVKDLTAAGFEILPYESYKDTPTYQSLIKIVGTTQSPIPVTFKYGDSVAIQGSDSLVFAPTGMVWYQAQAGEVSNRYATLTNAGKTFMNAMGRGLSGEQSLPKAEIALADELKASVLKAYYIVSPVRTTRMKEGYTIVGDGHSRFAFRTPGASTMHFTLSKNPPPMDGSAFVRLKKDVLLDPSLSSLQDIEAHLDAVREMFMTKLKAGK
ncbi:MAG: hypothetical protein HP490_04170 [Nitrospira sp.]|nr:hypothetical protein [Nitrospira sp.]